MSVLISMSGLVDSETREPISGIVDHPMPKLHNDSVSKPDWDTDYDANDACLRSNEFSEEQMKQADEFIKMCGEHKWPSSGETFEEKKAWLEKSKLPEALAYLLP